MEGKSTVNVRLSLPQWVAVISGSLILLGGGLRASVWALDTRYVTEEEWNRVVPHIYYVSCAVRAGQRGIDPAFCEEHLPFGERNRLFPRPGEPGTPNGSRGS